MYTRNTVVTIGNKFNIGCSNVYKYFCETLYSWKYSDFHGSSFGHDSRYSMSLGLEHEIELLPGRQHEACDSVKPWRQVQTQSRESDVIESEMRYFGLLFMWCVYS